jgi:hypothetical protein
MVADQESSRPLLDAAEIGKLPASESILLVAGFPPIRAQRFKYYEDTEFAARANLPPLKLRPGGPYPYRPPQHPNPWAGKVWVAPEPAKKPKKAPVTGERVQPALALTLGAAAPNADAASPPVLDVGEQLDWVTPEGDQNRRQALDEQERLQHERQHRGRRRIPL